MPAGTLPALTLPRARRLKQAGDFARLKSQGRRLSRGCLIANWLELAPGQTSRLGVITGKKIGPAVIRTRARRLLREAFRLHQLELKRPVDLVLVARSSIVGQGLAGVENDFLAALRAAKLLALPA